MRTVAYQGHRLEIMTLTANLGHGKRLEYQFKIHSWEDIAEIKVLLH